MRRFPTASRNPILTEQQIAVLTRIAQGEDSPKISQKAKVILSMYENRPDGAPRSFEERMAKTMAELQVTPGYIQRCLQVFHKSGVRGIKPDTVIHEPVSGNSEPSGPAAGQGNINDGTAAKSGSLESDSAAEGRAPEDTSDTPDVPIRDAFRKVDALHREQGVQIIRSLLDAQADGLCDKLRLAELAGQVEALGNQIGPSLLYGIASLPPEQHLLACTSVEALGRYMEGWPDGRKGTLSLSGLSLAVHTAYVMSFLREDVARYAMGFFMSFMPADDWNIAKTCSYYGFGQNRLKRGVEECCSQEFNWGEGMARKQGAGGPSIHDKTGEALGAAVAAVLVLMDQKEPKQSSSEPGEEKPEEAAAKEDGKAAIQPAEEKDDGETEAGKKKDDAPAGHTFKSLSDSSKGLDELAEQVKKALEEARQYAETNPDKRYLDGMLTLLTVSLDFYNRSLENNRPFVWKDDETAGQGTAPLVSSTAFNPKEEMLKRLRLEEGGFALDGLMKKLRAVCNQLLEIFTPSDREEEKRDQIKKAKIRVPKGEWSKLIVREKWNCMNARKDALRRMSAVLAALEAWTGSEHQANPAGLVGHLKEIDLVLFYEKTRDTLGALTADLAGSKEVACAQSAWKYLCDMEKVMTEEIDAEQLKTEDPNLRSALLVLLVYISSKVTSWESRVRSGGTAADVLRQVCAEVDYRRFHDAYELWLDNYRDAVQRAAAILDAEPVPDEDGQPAPALEAGLSAAAQEEGISAIDGEVKDTAGKNALPTVGEARSAWNSRKEAILLLLASLMGILQTGVDAKREKSYAKKDYTKDALDYLDNLRKKIWELDEGAQQAEDTAVFIALANLGLHLRDELSHRQEMVNHAIERQVNGSVSFTVANNAAASLLNRFQKGIQGLFDEYEQEIGRLKEDDGSWSEHCKECKIDEADMVHKMFFSEGHLTPLELLELIAKLLTKGQNPMDPMTWIDYIIDTAGLRDVYGDATDDKKYCNINRGRLENGFHYLTGLSFSENALYDIMTGPMGFSKRQSLKLEQQGAPSAVKYIQLDHIDAVLKNIDMTKTIVISLDTKALVRLGRMKTIGGVFMCAPGVMVPVSDHEFPFTYEQIYNGVRPEELFDEKEWEFWKDKPAILRPVCAYCLNDRSAYMGLVMCKDTAESMCNTILKAVLDKKKSMPGLENVLLLADGGGANMANGILWTSELKKLSDKIQLKIDVCHYPSGNSKKNPIEHEIFGPLSRYWKNFPLLTIKNVATHILEMTEIYPRISKMDVWLDTKYYKTREELKKANGMIPTRKAKDPRIISDYDVNDPMRKLNYSIIPSFLLNDESEKEVV